MILKSSRPLFTNHPLYSSFAVRLIVHVLFWTIMLVFIRYEYKSWSLNSPAGVKAWLQASLITTAIVALSFYALAYWGISHLYKKRLLSFLLCLLVVYAFNVTATYAGFSYLYKRFGIFEKIYLLYKDTTPLGLFANEHALVIVWSFTLSNLSPPLCIKITKDVLVSRTNVLRLERDNLRLELNFLQSQIQPHFIFNSLNSVYSMVAGVNDEAGTLLLRLSELLRYTLHESSSPYVSLAREADFLQGYVGIEAVRQQERTTIAYAQQGPLSDFVIAPMILITYVENAFKHGINATYREAWADIRLEVNEDGVLRFSVKNSKSEYTLKKKTPGGVGLENTQRRLHLLYPGNHELTIVNEKDTFSVYLVMVLPRCPEADPRLSQSQFSTLERSERT